MSLNEDERTFLRVLLVSVSIYDFVGFVILVVIGVIIIVVDIKR